MTLSLLFEERASSLEVAAFNFAVFIGHIDHIYKSAGGTCFRDPGPAGKSDPGGLFNQNASIWSKMLRNASKCFKMLQNGPYWSKMIQIVQKGTTCFKVVFKKMTAVGVTTVGVTAVRNNLKL